MRVTRSQSRQVLGNQAAGSKTGRSVLADVSENPQQQKKQKRQARKKAKPFVVAPDCVNESIVPAGPPKETVPAGAKPEWHSENPQFASECMDDIMKCYREGEMRGLPTRGYLSQHYDINQKMREILVDWVVEVHHKFNLRPAVLYTTVQLIDRYLGMCTVARSKLQLVGITAMLISSKMEEIFPPQVKDFVYISDRAYTQEEIIEMEQTILNSMKFRVAFPTMFSFAQQIVTATMCNEKTSQIASFLMDLTLQVSPSFRIENCHDCSVVQDYSALRFTPSIVASASVNLAIRIDRGLTDYDEKVWSGPQQQWVGYTEESLKECMEYLNSMIASPGDTELQAVKNKYSSVKWGNVARLISPLPVGGEPTEIEEFW